jgi:hypothetical protein
MRSVGIPSSLVENESSQDNTNKQTAMKPVIRQRRARPAVDDQKYP